MKKTICFRAVVNLLFTNLFYVFLDGFLILLRILHFIMNILPHKSWHVLNKDNIARVRADEAKAAEEEKQKNLRLALGEQEARTNHLRKQSRKRLAQFEEEGGGSFNDTTLAEHKPESHINFFADHEAGLSTSNNSKKNIDHEKEKKAEQEKYEKSIGLLTYLGQSALEPETSKPWYLEKNQPDTDKDTLNLKRSDKDEKLKNYLDPVHQMNEFINKKKKKHKKHRSHKEKKHNHRHKDDKASSECKQPSKTMAELRAERIKRETAEREKCNKIRAIARGEKVEEKKKEHVEVDDRRRKYNSQYNPDFVRVRKPTKDHGLKYH
ncbi:unnamed protein product [Owenia fusiformis]|uniref:Uncharacterized protein n=1 Tax=Owenia fusiformis TaxID=6347 RepID=A0A8J1TWV4_OWEFU|nr:unnamed protein product [Owenia fusiformis]